LLAFWVQKVAGSHLKTDPMEKIGIISSHFPPQKGGLADHTVILEKHLRQSFEVTTAYQKNFRSNMRWDDLQFNQCKAVILQYTPNLYGWKNRFPIKVLRYLHRKKIKTLTIFHEIFQPTYKGLFRNLVQRPFNRWKDIQCLKLSDICAVTTEFRQKIFLKQFGIQSLLLPAFSNIPVVNSGGKPQKNLLCMFGTFHHDVQITPVLDALRKVR